MSVAAPGGITCQEMVELVTEYLEGALAPDERARFDEHLAQCEACPKYLEQMRVTLRLLGRLRVEDVDPRAREELREAFRGWRWGGGARGHG